MVLFMIAFSKQIVRLPKAVVLKLKKRLTIREITRKVKGFHFDKWYFCQKADIKESFPLAAYKNVVNYPSTKKSGERK